MGGFLEHLECVVAKSGDSTILFILLEAKLNPVYGKNTDVKGLIDDWTEYSKNFMECNGYKGFRITDELMETYESSVLEHYKSEIRLLCEVDLPPWRLKYPVFYFVIYQERLLYWGDFFV